MLLRDTLRGTGVALVTPFDDQGNIDFNALGDVINFVLKGGVEYVVTLGTTGETPTLERQEKMDIIEFTCEKVNDLVPVVVGIGGNNTREILHDIETFPLERASAILSASPYYNKPSQEGLFLHYKAIAESTSKPIILYNVPARTGRNLTATTTMRLAHEVAGIAGIKEASGDMLQCMQILRDRPADFLVVSGDDALAFPQIATGMDGVISVAANCFPKEFSEMIRLVLNKDLSSAKRINDQLMEGYDILFSENNPAGVKAFLAELGILKNVLRLPLSPLSESMSRRVKLFLDSMVEYR